MEHVELADDVRLVAHGAHEVGGGRFASAAALAGPAGRRKLRRVAHAAALGVGR